METKRKMNLKTCQQSESFESTSKLYNNKIGTEFNEAGLSEKAADNEDESMLDDSLLNFKPHKLCLSRSNSKSDMKKSKKLITKNTSTKHKSTQNLKKMLNIPNKSSELRPIESSFFKPPDTSQTRDDSSNDVKTAHVCPFCFKIMKDSSSYSLHIKSCAMKNKVSTEELFNVIELQERQAAERKSLGLLPAPILQEKKKLPPRKKVLKEDTDYHLAMAISKSLQEVEDMNQIEEMKLITAQADSLGFTLSEQELYAGRLQNFGFKSDKVPVAPLVSSNVKKKLHPTVLQIRSEQDRNSILTEKIAEIIMGTDAVTQKHTVSNECEQNLQPVTLKNHSLKKMHQTENKLWDKSKLLSNDEFYVPQLASFIVPTDKKSESMKLSESNIMSIDSKPKINESLLENGKEKSNPTSFIETLIIDWGNALNTSYASDVIVFVGGNKHIWIHKLVLNVRCSNILLDIVPNDNPRFNSIKEKLCWTQISYDTALAFLEFIYCADISKYFKVLDDSNGFSDLRSLARKYKVPELFEYLTLKEKEKEKEALLKLSSKPNNSNQFMNVKNNIDDVGKISHISNNSPDLFEDSIEGTVIEDFHDENSKNTIKESVLSENEPIHDKIDENNDSNNVDLLLSLIRQDPDIDIQTQKFTSHENILLNSNLQTPKSSKADGNNDSTSIGKLFKRYKSAPIMNSHSPMDTPRKNRNRRRCNIFNLHIDNSNCYFDDLTENEEKQEPKRTNLSMLGQSMQNNSNEHSDLPKMDSPILISPEIELTKFPLVEKISDDRSDCLIENDDEQFNTTSFVETEKDSDISAYDKYKRKHSHNSVLKYRGMLEGLEIDVNPSTNDGDISPTSSLISNISPAKSDDSIDIDKPFLTQTKLRNDDSNDEELGEKSIHTASPVVLSSPESKGDDSDVEICDGPNYLNVIPHEHNTQSLSQHKINPKLSELDDEIDEIFQKSIFLRNVDEKKTTSNTNHITIERWNSTSRIEKKLVVGKRGKKSISEGNIQISPIKTGKKRNYTEISKCIEHDVYIRESTTPPPNYDRMLSPELDKELSKFGLKKQKRSRAIKLLTHIYNETHPLLTEAQCLKLKNKISRAFDMNDGPPLKKFNKAIDGNSYSENEFSEGSDTSCDSRNSIIGAEMEFDEPNTPSHDSEDIRHAFQQLLKMDTDLHNKILMYEPLNLELLHASLKTKGFKFKLNNLMDFLDEQCITFQVPESNFRSKKRKKT